MTDDVCDMALASLSARDDALVEDGAKIIADWIGYAWEGLGDRDISAEFPDWAYDGIMSLQMQGGKPALRKVAAAILALRTSAPEPSARAVALEEAAKVADTWVKTWGDKEITFVPANKYASDAVKDVADAIRDLASTAPPAPPSPVLRKR